MDFNSPTMTEIDTGLRFLDIGACLMLLTVLAVGQMARQLKIICMGLIAGAIAYLINSSSAFWHYSDGPDWIDLLSIFLPFWAWLLAQRLFERTVDAKIIVSLAVLLIIVWIFGDYVPAVRPLPFYIIHIIDLALVGHIIYLAISGRADDLVEKRRTVRTYLPLLIGIQAGGVLSYEIIFGTFQASPAISALNAGLILIVIMCTGLALLSPEDDLLSPVIAEKPKAPQALDLSPSEIVLHDKLKNAMNQGYYRTTGLNIQMLSDYLETPEHRLRALINKRLGHRNFSDFLNGHRISEAKDKLADRTLVDLPILTIAMDLGYNSLATFNRAFRGETGQTPSDFRKEAIGQN